MTKRVITYGTFDLLHYGHIELLRRAKDMGDYLIVALSTDEFNDIKGKKSFFDFTKRKELLGSIKYVDEIIEENNWEQKINDIRNMGIDIFVMGDDWDGKFDELKDLCEVRYISRTPTISSSAIKELHASIG